MPMFELSIILGDYGYIIALLTSICWIMDIINLIMDL